MAFYILNTEWLYADGIEPDIQEFLEDNKLYYHGYIHLDMNTYLVQLDDYDFQNKYLLNVRNITNI